MGAHQSLGQCSRGLCDLLAVQLCHASLGDSQGAKSHTEPLWGGSWAQISPFLGAESSPGSDGAGSKMLCACWQFWGWWDPNIGQQH